MKKASYIFNQVLIMGFIPRVARNLFTEAVLQKIFCYCKYFSFHMIGWVPYLLPRYVLAVQFIFSLIIMDTKITCLVYNLIMNPLEMPFKCFQLKLTRLTFFRNWVQSLVYYGQLFKLYPHGSAPFKGITMNQLFAL